MLTSPTEESTVVLVFPMNTCELLSLIKLQLALIVYGKTGDLLLGWNTFYCLLYFVLFYRTQSESGCKCLTGKSYL